MHAGERFVGVAYVALHGGDDPVKDAADVPAADPRARRAQEPRQYAMAASTLFIIYYFGPFPTGFSALCRPTAPHPPHTPPHGRGTYALPSAYNYVILIAAVIR